MEAVLIIVVVGSVLIGLIAVAGANNAIPKEKPFVPRPEANNAHGSARFLTDWETAEKFDGQSGYVIGRNPETGALCRLRTDRHMLTCAPNRSGKGVGTVIPNLLEHPGSVVCIDPKGENAVITHRHRATLGPVVVLDPFGETGFGCDVFNPLEGLADDPRLRDEVGSIVETLIPNRAGAEADEWWITGARTLLRGAVMYEVLTQPVPSLGHVRDLLTLELKATVAKMDEHPNKDVKKAARDYLDRSEKGQSDVLSTLRENTEFLDSDEIRLSLEGPSSFLAGDLKRGCVTVYVVLPIDDMSKYNRWFRLVVGQTIRGVSKSIAKPAHPVLFLMDEFAQLGYLRQIRDALGLMAGYGMCLWPIVQDLNQLKGHYGDFWETFTAAAGAIQYFDLADTFTAEHVSKSMGQRTVHVRTTGMNIGQSQNSADRKSESEGESSSIGFVGAPLMRPEQLTTELPKDRMVVIVRGEYPALLKKASYYADPEFAGRWDPDWRKDDPDWKKKRAAGP